MGKILIISKKKWDKSNYDFCENRKEFIFLNKININRINKIKPRIIFFIFWSKKYLKKFSQIFYVYSFILQIYQNLKEALQFKIKFLMKLKERNLLLLR